MYYYSGPTLQVLHWTYIARSSVLKTGMANRLVLADNR